MATTVSIEQSNPLREGLRLARVPEPCAFVIFGATGDLCRRKLMPSIFSLYRQRLLPPGFTILGFASSDMNVDQFRASMRESVQQFAEPRTFNESLWQSFAEGIFYIKGDLRDDSRYDELASELALLDRERGTSGNAVFYLAVPPSFFGEIVRRLGARKLARPQNGKWARVIIEKPFGHDYQSALALNEELAGVFDEENICRIDHYLGKDTVRNIMVLRFSNSMFEPIWNRHYVDHVQIGVAETLGVEQRGRYYEEAGAVRDIIQSHVLQLLALVAMEPPGSFESRVVRDEKIKVFHAIHPFADCQMECFAVRGQYGPGTIEGKSVPGYRQEPYVSPDSSTETYAALKLLIDSDRWKGVPFYLRTGKRLARRVTEIAIQFKKSPHTLFQAGQPDGLSPNVLAMRIQPDEGISIRMESKLPGLILRLRPVTMEFRYLTAFGRTPPEAYERLLLDCMLGDSTLFARRDAVEVAWSVMDPILKAWADSPPPAFPNYSAGSWGPAEADDFIRRDGRRWRRL